MLGHEPRHITNDLSFLLVKLGQSSYRYCAEVLPPTSPLIRQDPAS